MVLPKLTRPIYEYDLPISKKTIKIYPYVLKHHKILLMAMEGNDSIQIMNHTLDVMKDCLHPDHADLNLRELPFLDFEYLFIKLRAISLDNLTNIQAKCTLCDHPNLVELNLDETIVSKRIKSQEILKLDDNVNLTFKLPSVEKIDTYNKMIKNDPKSNEASLFSIYTYIDQVLVDKKPVDFTKEELIEWLNTLDVKSYDKISNYIANTPKIFFEVNKECASCKNTFQAKLGGFNNFFIFS